MNLAVVAPTVKISDGEWFGKSMHALGLNSLDIAKNLNVHRSTVDRVLQIFFEYWLCIKEELP